MTKNKIVHALESLGSRGEIEEYLAHPEYYSENYYLAHALRSLIKAPSETRPAWLIELVPSLGDCGSDDAWPGMVRRYAACAARWHVLDDAAWRRVLLATLRECLVIVLPYDTSGVVDPVISLIDEGAPADDPRWEAVAWAATLAKEPVKGSPWVAAWVAETTSKAAVQEAACVYEHVVERAAAAVVERAAATVAAGEASWDRITDTLLTAIERECSTLEDQGKQE